MYECEKVCVGERMCISLCLDCCTFSIIWQIRVLLVFSVTVTHTDAAHYQPDKELSAWTTTLLEIWGKRERERERKRENERARERE